MVSNSEVELQVDLSIPKDEEKHADQLSPRQGGYNL